MVLRYYYVIFAYIGGYRRGFRWGFGRGFGRGFVWGMGAKKVCLVCFFVLCLRLKKVPEIFFSKFHNR